MFVIFEEINHTGVKQVLCGGTPSQIIQQYQDINELNSLCYELSTTNEQQDKRIKDKISIFLEKYYADEIDENDVLNFSFCSSIYSHKVVKYCLSESEIGDFVDYIKSTLPNTDSKISDKYNNYLDRLKKSFKNKEDYKYVLKEMHKFRVIKSFDI